MKKILPLALLIAGLNCNGQAKGETFTADDFVGEGKFCTQLFYGTEMVGDRVQEGAWGRFERVEGSGNKIRLNSFKNEGAVTFTIDGDRLILDGTETKDGAACGSAKLRTVTIGNKEYHEGGLVWKPKYTYYYFKDSPSEYSGTITRDNDGNLSITFDSKYLTFRKRTKDLSDYNKVAEDYYNTFKKCEIHVLPCGNASEIDGYPVYVKTLAENDAECTYGVRNMYGCGEHFSYSHDGSWQASADGVMISVDKASNGITIPRQAYYGKMEPKLNTTYLPSPAIVGACVEDMKTVSYWVESNDGNDVSSDYKVVSRDITPGWHKSQGGNFSISETVASEVSWVNYSYGSDDARTDLSSTSHSINLTIDNTPAPVLEVTACEFNDNGIRVAGTITDDNLSDAVESYNVYLISGKHTGIDSDEFDGALAEGHSKALLVEENLVAESGSVSFDKLLSFQAPLSKGWNPYDNGGTMSVYLRYNLKPGVVTVSEAPLREPANVYAFGSMVARDRGIATGISSAVVENAVVRASEGMITVTGTTAPVSVYDASGRMVYSGKAGAIAVGSGLYIVRTGDSTAKVMIK